MSFATLLWVLFVGNTASVAVGLWSRWPWGYPLSNALAAIAVAMIAMATP